MPNGTRAAAQTNGLRAEEHRLVRLLRNSS
jgi:hypothetical protein